MLSREAKFVLSMTALSMITPSCKPGDNSRTTPTQIPAITIASSPPSQPDIIYKNINVLDALSVEYSPFIRNSGLIPTELKGSPKERIETGIDYLRRFRDALKDDVRNQGPSLVSLRINTPDNYPIAMPLTWNIWDVANSFLNEYDNKQTGVKFYSDADSIVTQNIFQPSENTIKRKTIIAVGKELIEKRLYHNKDQTYKNLTDFGLALSLLREYAHTLQDERVVQLYLAQSSNIYGYLPEKKEYANGVPRETAKQRGISQDVLQGIKFREAQAQAIAFLLPYSLNLISNVDLAGINPDENQARLYRLFTGTVIKNGATSQEWFLAHIN